MLIAILFGWWLIISTIIQTLLELYRHYKTARSEDKKRNPLLKSLMLNTLSAICWVTYLYIIGENLWSSLKIRYLLLNNYIDNFTAITILVTISLITTISLAQIGNPANNKLEAKLTNIEANQDKILSLLEKHKYE